MILLMVSQSEVGDENPKYNERSSSKPRQTGVNQITLSSPDGEAEGGAA